jgi:peptide/nickel transport system ATP-binding protein
MSAPLLQLRGASKRFHRGAGDVAAVVDVTLELARGETLAIVGPSGSGKSTLARIVTRLIEPDSGAIVFDGVDLLAARGEALRRLRPNFQMVFQDPLAAFNPRATVASVLDDPLRIHGLAGRAERPRAIAGLLERVGLDASLAERRIHEISGGQRQRVAIARAIATRPRLLVLDEAVSALDVTVRAGILALLAELRREEQLSYLFISHDLSVVASFADRIAIMDTGRIVETGPAAAVVAAPQSATGKALVAAMPRLRTGAVPT